MMADNASAMLRELRFTRSRQAVVMLAVGIGFVLMSVALLVMNKQWENHPPAWWWTLLPLPPACAFLWLAWQHLRRPYLVLSRIGIEIYPFLLPAQNMNLVLWQEIASAEVQQEDTMLALTLANFEDAKIFVTLRPMAERQRPLLAQAIRGVMQSVSSAKSEEL